MNVTEVRELRISKVSDDELPHRVEIIGVQGEPIKGAGITLAGALMSAFSVSGMFPTKYYPYRTNKELASFIFWQFGGGGNWVKAIEALEYNK